jgi:hypothetical protein
MIEVGGIGEQVLSSETASPSALASPARRQARARRAAAPPKAAGQAEPAAGWGSLYPSERNTTFDGWLCFIHLSGAESSRQDFRHRRAV